MTSVNPSHEKGSPISYMIIYNLFDKAIDSVGPLLYNRRGGEHALTGEGSFTHGEV